MRLLRHVGNKDYSDSDRYEFSHDFSLVIKGVEESDGGSYLCLLVTRDSPDRAGKIEVQVIGKFG